MNGPASTRCPRCGGVFIGSGWDVSCHACGYDASTPPPDVLDAIRIESEVKRTRYFRGPRTQGEVYEPAHGSMARWYRGCRCDDCADARAMQQRRYGERPGAA